MDERTVRVRGAPSRRSPIGHCIASCRAQTLHRTESFTRDEMSAAVPQRRDGAALTAATDKGGGTHNGRRRSGAGRRERRKEGRKELCVKVFEIQLMRDHIFHLPLRPSSPPSTMLSRPSVVRASLWRKVSIMNMDRHAILVRESCVCGLWAKRKWKLV